MGTCCSSRALTARGQANTAHRRRAEHAELHKLLVDGANAVRIVETLVGPTCTTATRKWLPVESLGQVMEGKRGIVVTALRRTKTTRGKGRCARRKWPGCTNRHGKTWLRNASRAATTLKPWCQRTKTAKEARQPADALTPQMLHQPLEHAAASHSAVGQVRQT